MKTTAQADRESLQAGWFTSQALSAIPIRAKDCLSLIKLGKEWYYSDKKPKGGLPPAVGHTCITRRLVLVHKSGEQFFVLLRTGASGTKTTKFPVARMGIEELQRAVKVNLAIILVPFCFMHRCILLCYMFKVCQIVIVVVFFFTSSLMSASFS